MTTEKRKAKRLESKARYVAKRAGLRAMKSRRAFSIDNFGEFMLLDPFHNVIVQGEKFDLSPEEVIEYCAAA